MARTEYVVELTDGIQLSTRDVREAGQYRAAGKRVREREVA